MDSVEKVTTDVSQRLGRDLKPQLVHKVMKEDLDLRWKKVKVVSLHENSIRNLVLRQRFAMKLLDITCKKSRVINIDESWLGMEDFRRMKW